MKSRVGAVIAAAGRSTRMGQPKALIHLAGRPVIEALLTAYQEAEIAPVIVVATGATLPALEPLLSQQVIAVEGDPAGPMVGSIAAGLLELERVAPDVTGALIQPVDAPFTSSAMLAAVLAGGTQAIRVLCHQGRPGHPILLPRRLFKETFESPEGGLRAILAGHDVELVEWLDERVLADIDTPEELERWRTLAGEDLN
jgi:CTP:molybdopterin cytidylyltransferase MocA